MRNHYDQADVKRIIDDLAAKVAQAFDPREPMNIVGIRTRGETIAQRLTTMLQGRGFDKIGRGILDITLYRDDLSEIGPTPISGPTEIDIPLDGIPLLLV